MSRYLLPNAKIARFAADTSRWPEGHMTTPLVGG
jgi:hypothetical protein